MNFEMLLRRDNKAVHFQPDKTNKKDSEDRARCSHSVRTIVYDQQDEVADIWNNFLNNTSCHGVRNIGQQTRSRPVRTLYTLSVIASLLGLLMSVFSLMSRVLEYNTTTRTEFFVDPNMTFPTITMCNICPFSFRNKNESDPLFRMLAKSSVFGSVLPDLDFNESKFKEFFQRTTEDVMKEYFMELDFRLAEYDGHKLTMEHFERLDVHANRCFQFNGPRHVAKNGPWRFVKSGRSSGLRVLVNIKQDDYGIHGDGTAGMKVYISHVKGYPDIHNHGIAVLPGTSTRISIRQHQISFLPSPYTSFGSEYCLDGDEESPELVAKMVNASFYSFQKCREQCIAYKASMACSCYHVELVIPGLKACTVQDYLFGCYRNATKRLISEVHSQCDCPRICTLMQYDVTLSASQFLSQASREVGMKFLNETDMDKIKANYLDVRVYFETPFMWMEKHDPEYTFQNFLSSLGGQLGISIGASFITLVEFWELIFRTLPAVVRRLRGQRSAPRNVVSEKQKISSNTTAA